jgi:hypothetical protein
MGFFGFVFWIIVLWLAFRTWGRWQRRRWMTVGPRGYGRVSGWYDSREFYAPRDPENASKRRETSQKRQEYIDALESRVTELEERVDFTERLLAGRREGEIQATGQPSS